ncbi:efflux RND transporter permease subunit, partial [Acinetobacter baumannii]|nr:efflux RND transporter permease subunit [Acinetobacter baumannii]
CVFAPIVFTEGITRQLFVEMGLTIAYSLIASLVVALTVVPMMSAGLLKKTEEKPSRWLDKLQETYSRLILKVLQHKGWVLAGALLLFVASMML